MVRRMTVSGVLALVFVLPTLSWAQSASVKLNFQPVDKLKSRKVTVLKLDKSTGVYSIQSENNKIDRDGTCDLELEKGTYVFECFYERGNPMVCIRSPETVVTSESQQIDIPVIVMNVKMNDGEQEMEISRFAARSLVPFGATKKFKTRQESFKMLVAKGSRLNLNVAGKNDRLTCFGWFEVECQEEVTLLANSPDWHRCVFTLSPNNPSLQSSRILINDPFGRLNFLMSEPVMVLTNLTDFEYQYRLVSNDGPQLISRMHVAYPEKAATVKIGGRLEPAGFATKLYKHKGQTHLVYDTTLFDEGGHEIHVRDSKIEFASQEKVQGERPPKNPLDDSAKAMVGNPLESVQLKVAWKWIDQQRVAFSPSPFETYESRKFSLDAPKGWTGRARLYLAAVEKMQAMQRIVTGKKGRAKTYVTWRRDTNRYRTSYKGKTARINVSFQGLEDMESASKLPKFVAKALMFHFVKNSRNKSKLIEDAIVAFNNSHWLMPAELNDALTQKQAPSSLAATDQTKELAEKIEIISAKFGHGNAWADVTTHIRSLMKSGSYSLANNPEGYGGIDPKKGKQKTLIIEYRFRGSRKTKKLKESTKRKYNLVRELAQ